MSRETPALRMSSSRPTRCSMTPVRKKQKHVGDRTEVPHEVKGIRGVAQRVELEAERAH
jgi:hypothetical protein